MAQRTATITCPSGLTGTIRNLSGEEGNILADKQIQRQGKLVDEILRHCWLSTESTGLAEYPMKGAGPDWSAVLSGDRMFAFVQVRLLTWPGRPYEFKIQCDAPGCGRPSAVEVKLDELASKKLTAEAAKVFVAGNKFPGKLPDGRAFTYRLLTGKHEQIATKLLEQNPKSRLTIALSTRIVSIDGVDSAPSAIDDALKEIELGHHMEILAMLEESDCGIETGIPVVCDHCGNKMDADVPFSGGFFFPKRARTVRGIED